MSHQALAIFIGFTVALVCTWLSNKERARIEKERDKADREAMDEPRLRLREVAAMVYANQQVSPDAAYKAAERFMEYERGRS